MKAVNRNRIFVLIFLITGSICACPPPDEADGGAGNGGDGPSPTPETPSFANTAPEADAGTDRNVELGEVRLDGSGSSDADDDPLAFSWEFVSLPAESAITNSDIVDREEALAYFTPDVTGVYEIRLTVSDGTDTSENTVRIEVFLLGTSGTAIIRLE